MLRTAYYSFDYFWKFQSQISPKILRYQISITSLDRKWKVTQFCLQEACWFSAWTQLYWFLGSGKFLGCPLSLIAGKRILFSAKLHKETDASLRCHFLMIFPNFWLLASLFNVLTLDQGSNTEKKLTWASIINKDEKPFGLNNPCHCIFFFCFSFLLLSFLPPILPFFSYFYVCLFVFSKKCSNGLKAAQYMHIHSSKAFFLLHLKAGIRRREGAGGRRDGKIHFPQIPPQWGLCANHNGSVCSHKQWLYFG